jgi:hypothetical protein
MINDRRDFRLLIGNPDDPKKAMANPVFWFNIDVITEVNRFSFYYLLNE